MTSMRELFSVPPPRSTKNFIALNVRNVKKPEKATGQARRATSQTRTSKETNGPIPRVLSGKLPNLRTNIKSDKSKPKTFRHAGCQTLNLDLDESLLEEGVIRYPSSKWKERSTHDHQFKSIALQTESKLETNASSSNTELMIPTEDIDNHVLGNNAAVDAACDNNENQDINNIHPFHENEEPISPALSVVTVIENPKKTTRNPVVKNTNLICTSTNSLNNDVRKNNTSTTLSKVPGKHKRGTVPRYIIEKKLEKEREERRVMEEAERTGILDPDCPPGHILLPTEKRLEQLEFLKKNYKNLINELYRIPVRNDSLKIRQHRVMTILVLTGHTSG
uniref:Enkurin domain-containing protein 1 n=1 Tax=Cacopsylla melanoneura TaxID=428564 RepID=A0A8D8XCR7_9HEMI